MTLHSDGMTFVFFIISKRLPKTGQKYEDKRVKWLFIYLGQHYLRLAGLVKPTHQVLVWHFFRQMFFCFRKLFCKSFSCLSMAFMLQYGCHALVRLVWDSTGLTWKLATAAVEMLRIVTHFTRSYDERRVKQGSTFLRSTECLCEFTVRA